ncbi:MAG: lipoyl domain-containing protein [Chloroflexota bacterium]|nr:lipoyl domain-containing protein [Chloroflexota bacterium]
METEVIMPTLGESVKTGMIMQWNKSEGSPVQKGESLFVVMTHKAAFEVDAPVSGILSKILVEKGTMVPVGKVIAYILQSDK